MKQQTIQGAQLFESPPEFKLLKQFSKDIKQLKDIVGTLQYKLNQLEKQCNNINKEE